MFRIKSWNLLAFKIFYFYFSIKVFKLIKSTRRSRIKNNHDIFLILPNNTNRDALWFYFSKNNFTHNFKRVFPHDFSCKFYVLITMFIFITSQDWLQQTTAINMCTNRTLELKITLQPNGLPEPNHHNKRWFWKEDRWHPIHIPK